MNFQGLNKKDIILSVVSGILLILSFPKFGQGIFAWISLVPLLYALEEKNISAGLSIGFISGFVSQIGIIYWITYVIVNYGYLPFYIGLCAMLLLAAYLGLYVALFGAGIVYFRGKGISQLISVPLLWTSLEYTKSHLFTGFPWENLAYSQYLFKPVIQIADISGTYGVTFLIVWINVLFYYILSARIETRRRMWSLIAGIMVISIVCGYGEVRMRHMKKAMTNARSMEASIIQGNIDQSIKWDPIYQKTTLDIYSFLSGQVPSSVPGLIVWPETAVPFYFQDIDQRHREIIAIAKKSGKWVLFGGPSYRSSDTGLLSYSNSAFLLSPAGDIAGRYDKVHLVPYGEYVPLRKLFPFINKLAAGIGDFQAGEGFMPLPMENNHRVGVLICYEGILPEAGRAYKKLGADLLVNITNDAWFGRTSAPYQHLSMTVFRSVENRLFLIRAANTGISAIIDPTGSIVNQTELFERTTLSGWVKFLDEETFYTLYGDVFIYACLISLMIIYLISFKRRR